MSGNGDLTNLDSGDRCEIKSSDLPTRTDAQSIAPVRAEPDQPGVHFGRAELSPTALGRVAAAVIADEHAAGWIDRYRLTEIIGQGGMGEVWRAEQERPIRRAVALKLIKLGMDSRQVIARFESERQALAMMDHPNIAKVLDAGTSEGGRPYFVMEFVAGEPITAFCDRHRYTTRQRLELFMQACDAIRHAHQRAIIHRDLKPSNLLVMLEDGRPLVKVIDFGVAKAVSGRLMERTLYTERGQFVGTPEYMSPEQAEMSAAADVDTRSDVYSLGVVLYELLTGVLPFDPKALRDAGLSEILRILREVEPPRPSTRLSGLGENVPGIAKCRRMHPDDLRRQLSGELEWIPLKAMRKERAQRYASVTELAQDVRNYLEQRPLLAGPESALYRFRKFVRRRRVEMVAASLVVISLVAGIIGTITFAVRASQQRGIAEKNAEETLKVVKFQAEMLSDLDAQEMGLGLRDDLLAEAERNWRNSNATEEEISRRRAELLALLTGANFTNPAIRSLERNIIDRALETIEREFADQPLLTARLLQHVADTLRNWTRLEAATEPQAEALEIRQQYLGNHNLETLESMHSTGLLLAAKGKWVEAEPYARDVLDRRRQLLVEHHQLILSSKRLLAEVLQRQNRLAEAEPLRREVMEGFQGILSDDDPQTLDAMLLLGQVLCWQGRLRISEPYIERAIQGMQRVYGSDHWRPKKAKVLLGNLRRLQGRPFEALELFREAYEGTRAVSGDHHRDTLYCVVRLGAALRMQGALAEAESYLQRAIDGFRHELGDDHFDTLNAIYEMSLLRQAQGKFPEAEACLRDAIENIGRKGLIEAHSQTAWMLNSLGTVLAEQGKFAEAEKLYRQATEIRRSTLPATHPDVPRGVVALGSVMWQQRKLADAERLYREAVQMRRNEGPAGQADLAIVLHRLGNLRVEQGEVADAEHLLREALELRRETLGAHADTAWTLELLAGAVARQGRLSEAEPLYRETLDVRRSVHFANDPETLRSLSMVAWICRTLGDLNQAESYYRQALNGYRDSQQEDRPNAIGTMTGLARVLWLQDKLADAQPLFQEALDRRRRVFKNDHNTTLLALRDLGKLDWARGRLREAEVLLQERLDRRQRAFGMKHQDTAIARVDKVLLIADQGRPKDADPLLFELHSAACEPQLSPEARARALSWYGYCLVQLDRYAEAEAPLRQAREELRQAGLQADPRMRDVVYSLATVCHATGRAEEAARWRDELASLEATAGPFRVDLNPQRWSRTSLRAVMAASQEARRQGHPTTRAVWGPMTWDH